MKFNKSTIIKIAVAVALAVVAFFVVKYLVKKGKERAEDRKKAKNQAQLIVELENNGAAKPELTTSQVQSIATDIHDGIDGLGTDEKKVVDAIKSIPTAIDYITVSKYYTEKFGDDMWKDIKDDIDEPTDSIWNDSTDAWAWGEIVSHLNKISVPENMR